MVQDKPEVAGHGINPLTGSYSQVHYSPSGTFKGKEVSSVMDNR